MCTKERLARSKTKKASTGSRTPYLPAKSAWPFPLHHDTLHVHPSLKMQLYNPLTIVPSSGPLSLWPSHSFWDPNLIKKCPPVPTIIAWTRIMSRARRPSAVAPSHSRAPRQLPTALAGPVLPTTSLAACYRSELLPRVNPCIMRWMSTAQRDACHG